MTGRGLHVPESLTGAQWKLLFNQTVLYANSPCRPLALARVNRPNSIAAQAVADLLEHQSGPGGPNQPGPAQTRRELEFLRIKNTRA